MPLTALHTTAGVLDLTAPTIGALAWEEFHRVRPRAPLTCRECGHGLHAKVSRLDTRFFAHDVGAPTCSLTGETMAHRLLKIELAAAVRAAGWHAELEVAGAGWRADVLATSPDGQTRMAWEAQLASTTAQELIRRTATMAAEGVEVCWVSDKNTSWMGHVPSIRVAPPGEGKLAEAESGLAVAVGLAVFEPFWCGHFRRCDYSDVPHGRHPGPCPGHGLWRGHEGRMDLHAFVGHVVRGTVRTVRSSTSHVLGSGGHDQGPHVWTTRPHWAAEQRQLQAQSVRDVWAAGQLHLWEAAEQQRAQHEAAIADLLARQAALRPLAVEFVAQQAGGNVLVHDPAPDWAMGVPLFVEDLPQAVISPVASRVDPRVKNRLASVTVVVADAKERKRLARVCAAEQRFEEFEVDTAKCQKSANGISIHEALGRLMPRY